MKQEIKQLMSEEELLQWQKELYELEPYFVSGKFISEEQQDKNVQELLDPNYLQNQLDKVRAYKQKLQKKLLWAEEREQLLVEEIQQE